jgi:hypothetical protein
LNSAFRGRAWLGVALALGAAAGMATELADPARCAAITSGSERLACYDAIFGGSEPAGDAAAVPAQARRSAPPRLNNEEQFGLSEASRRALEAKAGTPAQESLSARVKQVRRQPTGHMVVTLENDQVWVQSEVDPRARVEVGDTVTIRKAALGSFLLLTEQRVATRVRRLQ